MRFKLNKIRVLRFPNVFSQGWVFMWSTCILKDQVSLDEAACRVVVKKSCCTDWATAAVFISSNTLFALRISRMFSCLPIKSFSCFRREQALSHSRDCRELLGPREPTCQAGSDLEAPVHHVRPPRPRKSSECTQPDPGSCLTFLTELEEAASGKCSGVVCRGND